MANKVYRSAAAAGPESFTTALLSRTLLPSEKQLSLYTWFAHERLQLVPQFAVLTLQFLLASSTSRQTHHGYKQPSRTFFIGFSYFEFYLNIALTPKVTHLRMFHLVRTRM